MCEYTKFGLMTLLCLVSVCGTGHVHRLCDKTVHSWLSEIDYVELIVALRAESALQLSCGSHRLFSLCHFDPTDKQKTTSMSHDGGAAGQSTEYSSTDWSTTLRCFTVPTLQANVVLLLHYMCLIVSVTSKFVVDMLPQSGQIKKPNKIYKIQI